MGVGTRKYGYWKTVGRAMKLAPSVLQNNIKKKKPNRKRENSLHDGRVGKEISPKRKESLGRKRGTK